MNRREWFNRAGKVATLSFGGIAPAMCAADWLKHPEHRWLVRVASAPLRINADPKSPYFGGALNYRATIRFNGLDVFGVVEAQEGKGNGWIRVYVSRENGKVAAYELREWPRDMQGDEYWPIVRKTGDVEIIIADEPAPKSV